MPNRIHLKYLGNFDFIASTCYQQCAMTDNPILIDSGKYLEALTEMLINIMKKKRWKKNDEKAKETESNSTFPSLKKKNKKI